MSFIRKQVLLAPNEQIPFDDPRLVYPMFGSCKFDGDRAIVANGFLFTRQMKSFGNPHLESFLMPLLRKSYKNHLVFDLELVDTAATTHGATQSLLFGNNPLPPTFAAMVFDCCSIQEWNRDSKSETYENRLDILQQECPVEPNIYCIGTLKVKNSRQANTFFQDLIKNGNEGLILRDPKAHYKHGRATVNEGIIYKFKQFITEDGRIIGVNPRYKLKTGIPRTKKPNGLMETVYKKDAYEPIEAVGNFVVLFEDGTTACVNYGAGFDMAIRYEHWKNQKDLIGKMVEVKHMKYGAKTKKRIATLVRFRPDKD